jgi:site-specific recombinase XerD
MITVNIAMPIHSFFEQHLVVERGLSQHTILAYRDSLKLLLAFAAKHLRRGCEELTIADLSADTVRQFLSHIETVRHNSARTRNARLAAIHAFFRYLSTVDPRLLIHCQSILGIPFKRYRRPVLDYLRQEEVTGIFSLISHEKRFGSRDEAILRLLYNSGARAQELVNVDIVDVRFSRPYLVRLHGKGYKERTCPLWPETMVAIKSYLHGRASKPTDCTPLFVNSKGNRLTRFGLRYIVGHRVADATKSNPTLLTRRIGPHSWRHTTAMHLLQSGVDLNMIRSWLGHASIDTTNEYVEIDLDMKRKTLQSCAKLLPKPIKEGPSWKRDRGILEWLSKL